MKKTTIERAKKALRLMEEGVSFTKSAKAVKMKPKTLKKALRTLKVKTRKVRGKVRLYKKLRKERIDLVIYYMMGGWSATRACQQVRTTLRTVLHQTVKVNNRKRAVIVKGKGPYYILNVYKIYGYHTVFYGRLLSTDLGIPVTGEKNPREPETDETKLKFPDPAYKNIMWQLDFDPFTSTLLNVDVCEHYPQPVMDVLEEEIPVKVLQTYFQRCAGFDDKIYCGIDDRGTVEKYVSKTTYNARRKAVDIGRFRIIVRSITGSDYYPDNDVEIKFKHNLDDEWKIPRRVSFKNI